MSKQNMQTDSRKANNKKRRTTKVIRRSDRVFYAGCQPQRPSERHMSSEV